MSLIQVENWIFELVAHVKRLICPKERRVGRRGVSSSLSFLLTLVVVGRLISAFGELGSHRLT